VQKKLFVLGALCAILALCCPQNLTAQSMFDVSVGTSNADRFSLTAAYRYQVNAKCRVGLDVQYGAPKYRFVNAKPITEGYSTTIAIPLTWRLYEKENLRLDAFMRAGLRFQGVLDPDKNDIRDSIKASTALIIDPGLIVTIKTSEKLSFQSGITFPIAFQTSPSALFESAHTPLVYMGLNAKMTENRTIFVRTLFGEAAGGDGDTYKFGWVLQGGVRFTFGQKPVAAFVEPAF
jgi:hypothetical protein